MNKGAFIAFAILMLVSAACSDPMMQEGAEWLREPVLDNNPKDLTTELPSTDIFEVNASKVELAFMALEETSVAKLTPETAVWYTGHAYTCPPDKQAFLVRAVYGHAGTGAFRMKRLKDDLLIIHESLGHTTIYQKTALVVNLDFEPDQIYIRVNIAE